jgi:hypothetical protein
MQRPLFALTALISALFLLAPFVDGQTRRRSQRIQKPSVTPAAAATPEPGRPDAPEVSTSTPKRNVRPDGIALASVADPGPAADPPYLYEFTQPDFAIPRIVIKHDDDGRGTILFERSISGESITEPIELSAATMERVRAALEALNFLRSNENYQYEKDYSHLGNMKFRLRRDGAERTTTFNYTTNKLARALGDEYRRIGNQFIWIFDISVSRENQPLESPKLLDTLDSLVRRGEIADPKQMVPLLESLSLDERLPLIARNHATRLIKQIEKTKK